MKPHFSDSMIPLIDYFAHYSNVNKPELNSSTHKCYRVYIVGEGSFEYSIGEDEFEAITAGYAVCCPPDVPFRMRNLVNLSLYVVMFIYDDCDAFLRKFQPTKRMFESLSAISHYTVCPRPASSATVSHYCQDFLIELVNSFSAEYPDDIKLIIDYIEKNLPFNILNLHLARLMGCSVVKMIDRFKHFVGITPHRYIIEKRIELAIRLLSEDNCSVGAVSKACGFDDPLYFSKVFSAETGVSPREFKKYSQL